MLITKLFSEIIKKLQNSSIKERLKKLTLEQKKIIAKKIFK